MLKAIQDFFAFLDDEVQEPSQEPSQEQIREKVAKKFRVNECNGGWVVENCLDALSLTWIAVDGEGKVCSPFYIFYYDHKDKAIDHMNAFVDDETDYQYSEELAIWKAQYKK